MLPVINDLHYNDWQHLFASYLTTLYRSHFSTEQCQYLIHFIESERRLSLLHFTYKAKPNARFL